VKIFGEMYVLSWPYNCTVCMWVNEEHVLLLSHCLVVSLLFALLRLFLVVF